MQYQFWISALAILTAMQPAVGEAQSAKSAASDPQTTAPQAAPPSGEAAPLENAPVSATADPLDQLLSRAGIARSDIGYSRRGWWLNHPASMQYELDLKDDLVREPLALVPFARTLAQVVREDLNPDRVAGLWAKRDYTQGPAGHSVFRFAQAMTSLRYGGIMEWITDLRSPETPLDQAIVEIERDGGRRPVVHTYEGPPTNDPVYYDARKDLKHRLKGMPPEVSRILGRLLLDVRDVHRGAELAFRNVPAERRIAVHNLIVDPKITSLFFIDDHTYSDLTPIVDVTKSWDEGSLWQAGVQSVEALDEARRALQQLPPAVLRRVPDFDWLTPYGWIRIRGKSGGDQVDASGTLLLVDLAGGHRWRGSVGASSPTQLVGLALDMAGGNTYEGQSGTQGAGIAGIGVLMDARGNNTYKADSFAQGTGLLGFGALINLAGKNVYEANHVAQGSAPFVGVGIIAGVSGANDYRLLTVGQGYGGPGGVGIIADWAGNNTYLAEPDMRKGWPGYGRVEGGSSSQAQGFGMGLQSPKALGQQWSGGIGALINVGGQSRYTAGSWAQGVGENRGIGLLYSGRGRNTYSGGPFTQAAAGHYSIGVLIDDGGDNTHNAENSSFGFAHDVSIAMMVSNGDNNRFRGATPAISMNRSPLGMFVNTGNGATFTCSREPLGVGNKVSPGNALYDEGFVGQRDGTGTLVDTTEIPRLFPAITSSKIKNTVGAAGRVRPYFAYLRSYALFLNVGQGATYENCGSAVRGGSWGDQPGSANWGANNIGAGLDLPSGSIDWRPLPASAR